MRRAILFVLVLMLRRHAASAQGTMLADASTESPGGDSGVSRAPSITPKATPTVEFTPLTASKRLRLYLTTTYGPQWIVHSAAAAGISQWRDAPKEWKQGAEAYGDRFENS
jgi:hypothetical protein